MAVEDDILEIRKETVETHNLIIKTDNLIKNLASDLKVIQKKQERYERKYIFNSVVAYVLFVVVIFGGLYVAFDAKVSVVRREKDTLAEQLKKTRGEADDLQAKLSTRAQQEKAAERFLKLKKENQDAEALKVAETLDPNQLSSLVARFVGHEVDALRGKVSAEAMEAGKNLFKGGQLANALREFDRALKVSPPPDVQAKVQLQRGQVLLKLNRTAKGAEAFLAAANADPGGPACDFALFQAAAALEMSGDVPRALTIYERLVRDFAKSNLSTPARTRLAKLGRAGSQPAPVPAPQTPAAPETPPEPTPDLNLTPGDSTAPDQ